MADEALGETPKKAHRTQKKGGKANKKTEIKKKKDRQADPEREEARIRNPKVFFFVRHRQWHWHQHRHRHHQYQ